MRRRPDAQDVAAAGRSPARRAEHRVPRQARERPARTADVAWLKPGAGEAYKMACVRAGQREGQFKPAVLQYRKDLRFSFDDYVARPSRHDRRHACRTPPTVKPLRHPVQDRFRHASAERAETSTRLGRGRCWTRASPAAASRARGSTSPANRSTPRRRSSPGTSAPSATHVVDLASLRALDGVARAGDRRQSGCVVCDRARDPRSPSRRTPTRRSSVCSRLPRSPGTVSLHAPCSATQPRRRSRRPPISTAASGSPTSR